MGVLYDRALKPFRLTDLNVFGRILSYTRYQWFHVSSGVRYLVTRAEAPWLLPLVAQCQSALSTTAGTVDLVLRVRQDGVADIVVEHMETGVLTSVRTEGVTFPFPSIRLQFTQRQLQGEVYAWILKLPHEQI